MRSYSVDKLVSSDSTIENVSITVEGDLVTGVVPSGERPADSHAAYAVPGFIDIHTHGALGLDTMDASVDSLKAIAEYHLSTGTTSFLSSTLTAPLSELRRALVCIGGYLPENRANASRGREARILGAHVEGPWISKNNPGAHDVRYIIEPDDDALKLLDDYSALIKMVTLSYHTAGAKRLLTVLRESGIVAASGHDEAVDDDILEAFHQGLDHVTHIYSNTSSFQRKDRYKHLGTLEMALMTPGVTIEVIADGKHITESFWKFLRHNKGVEDIILVSDSTLGAGLPENPDKVYLLGGQEILVDDGVAWTADRSLFAGSTTTMHGMFRRLVFEWGVDLKDAVGMTSLNPARRLGLDSELGEIVPGKKADFLLLSEDLTIKKIVKSGIERLQLERVNQSK